MRSAFYRLRQFRRALLPRISPEEQKLVERTLPPQELALYQRMPLRDRRHCLDVYHTLARAGCNNPLLLRAALYHDTGKVDQHGRPVPLLWYGILVIWKRLLPASYALLAASPCGIRRYFYYYEHHARLGADLARQAGAPESIVEAIAHYHDQHPRGLAATLQWADRQN